jgi:hypothetical protein
MIEGVSIDWQRHCGQFEHQRFQSSLFLPSSSLSLPVVDTSQKCQNLPLEGSDNYTAHLHEVTGLCFHQAIYSVYVYLWVNTMYGTLLKWLVSRSVTHAQYHLPAFLLAQFCEHSVWDAAQLSGHLANPVF